MSVRKPATFWTFLVLGLLFLVGAVFGAVGDNWVYAGVQLGFAALCLSLPFRLSR